MLSDSSNHKQTNSQVEELEYAVADIDLLIAYIIKSAKNVPQQLLSQLVACKHFGPVGQWSYEQESQFWLTLKEALVHIQPATLSSIKASADPTVYASVRTPAGSKSLLHRTLYKYSVAAVIVTVCIVFFQMYHLVGKDVLGKSKVLFEQRSDLRREMSVKEINAIKLSSAANHGRDPGATEIDSIPNVKRTYAQELLAQDTDYQALRSQEMSIDQKFDANRALLYQWNRVWRLGREPITVLSAADQYRYDNLLAKLKQQTDESTNLESEALDTKTAVQDEIANIELDRTQHLSRDEYFRSGLSAMFVLNLLHHYILPLLYGMLGALIMVLRSLSRSIKNDAFNPRDLLDYQLRAVLGAVAGMASGLFFGKSGVLEEQHFSLMLIAFLVGYNVNVLFSMIDALASQVTTSVREKNPPSVVDKQSNNNP